MADHAPRQLTDAEQAELDNAAAALGRTLSFWQVHMGNRFPALMFKEQAKYIRDNAIKVLFLLAKYDPTDLAGIHVSLDPRLDDETAAKLAEIFTDGEIPSEIPDDWKDV